MELRKRPTLFSGFVHLWCESEGWREQVCEPETAHCISRAGKNSLCVSSHAPLGSCAFLTWHPRNHGVV